MCLTNKELREHLATLPEDSRILGDNYGNYSQNLIIQTLKCVKDGRYRYQEFIEGVDDESKAVTYILLKFE